MDTLCPYSPPPLEPPLRGPPIREAGSQRKGASGQRTGLRSITAAAELSVTFGDCSYRWKARLLSCLGSSAAQGIGGRVRTPAPTEHTEDDPVNVVGADDLGGPRAHSVRPYG